MIHEKGKKVQAASWFMEVCPTVQAHNDPGAISNEEFETVLKGGLAGKSSGVMMFITYAVAEDEGKTEMMENVYAKLMEKLR